MTAGAAIGAGAAAGADVAGAARVDDLRVAGAAAMAGIAVVVRPRVSASSFGEGTAATVPANAVVERVQARKSVNPR